MKLSYITFHPADESSAASWVEEQLRQLNIDRVRENSCATLREFLTLFAKEVETQDILLLGVGGREFQRVKTTVAKALGMSLFENTAVCERLQARSGLEEALCRQHAALPEGTQPLLTEDGVDSGFYAQSGTQHLFFFPLEEERTPGFCAQMLFPILIGLLCPSGIPCPLTEEEREEILRAAQGMKRHQLLLSVAQTSIFSTLEDIVAAVPELQEVLVMPEKNDVKCPPEEVMIKAKDVRRDQQTAFGGAISSVFESENGMGQVHVALAAPGRALRSQLSAPMQAERNLKKTAVVCLCSMINHQLSQWQAAEALAPDTRLKSKKSRKLPVIFAAMLAVAVIACVILGIVLKNQGAKPKNTSVGAVGINIIRVAENPVLLV